MFKRGVSWGEVLDDLRGGKGLEHAITIPEGWSLLQIVPQLARVLEVPVDSVQAAVRDTALLHALDVPTPTLEGYLFPDTYVFTGRDDGARGGPCRWSSASSASGSPSGTPRSRRSR